MRIYLLWLLLASAPAFAECSAQSGEQTVPLLELYTSEGCSNCPPADKWLSQLKGTNMVVPLAFHVDYWDYIGWKDRFARPEFSARQRQAAALNHSTFVYTPQVMLNGRDYRGWRNASNFEKTIAAIQQPARIQLGLNLITPASGRMNLQAWAQTGQMQKDADIYVAVYENNMKSRVGAGENSGRELKHDYVVREWLGPYRLQNAGRWERIIPLTGDWQQRDAGVAMFVQNRNSGEVLQALSLDFCG